MEKKQSFSPEPGDLYAQTDPSSIVFDQCDNMSNFLTKSLNAMEVNTRKVTTENARQAFADIMALLEDSRLFLANALLHKLEEFLMKNPDSDVTKELVKELEVSHQRRIQQLRQRVQMMRNAIHDFDMEEQWNLANKLMGITTWYKTQANGSVTIKLRASMDTKFFFDQLAVLREADQYKRWMPYITESSMLKEIGKFENLVWYNIVIPLIGSRDCCLHMFGCDHLEEGILLLMGNSVEEFEGVDLPARPSKKKGRRSEIRDVRVRLRTLSPDVYDTDVIFNVNPNLPLPRWLLNFGLKNLSGAMLYYISKEAMRSAADPISSPYAIRMRNHPYYTGYVAPRLAAYFDSKKWQLLSFPALEISKDKVKNEIEGAALNLWQNLKKENGSSLPETELTSLDEAEMKASVV